MFVTAHISDQATTQIIIKKKRKEKRDEARFSSETLVSRSR